MGLKKSKIQNVHCLNRRNIYDMFNFVWTNLYERSHKSDRKTDLPGKHHVYTAENIASDNSHATQWDRLISSYSNNLSQAQTMCKCWKARLYSLRRVAVANSGRGPNHDKFLRCIFSGKGSQLRMCLQGYTAWPFDWFLQHVHTSVVCCSPCRVSVMSARG